MKLYNKKQDIVYMVEETLNLYDGKKKIDKVVSGRVIKTTFKLLCFSKVKYKYQVNIPKLGKTDSKSDERFREVFESVCKKCTTKIKEMEGK